jgi:hypothetical protein
MLNKLFGLLENDIALKEMRLILTQIEELIENLDGQILKDSSLRNDAIDCIVELLQNLKTETSDNGKEKSPS